eukprot:5715770-Amphidinium_carterae.1
MFWGSVGTSRPDSAPTTVDNKQRTHARQRVCPHPAQTSTASWRLQTAYHPACMLLYQGRISKHPIWQKAAGIANPSQATQND